MLNDYKEKTGLPCNAHTFMRTFASNLHRRGMDIEHIMRVGAWESLEDIIKMKDGVKVKQKNRSGF